MSNLEAKIQKTDEEIKSLVAKGTDEGSDVRGKSSDHGMLFVLGRLTKVDRRRELGV